MSMRTSSMSSRSALYSRISLRVERLRSLSSARFSMRRTRSLVQEWRAPTSLTDLGWPSSRPKRMRRTLASRCGRRLIMVSMTSLSVKRCTVSSGDSDSHWSRSPTVDRPMPGVPLASGRCLSMLNTVWSVTTTVASRAEVMPSSRASSSMEGGRPSCSSRFRHSRPARILSSCTCAGSRMTRPESTTARVIFWRIQYVA
mmetsp:Transcript_14804/g.44613  ORF Transcript_14804/g.44613 Transcript_14804/m.44613 type:complete len:200 (-) Transcript_14804:953-1552(-)